LSLVLSSVAFSCSSDSNNATSLGGSGSGSSGGTSGGASGAPCPTSTTTGAPVVPVNVGPPLSATRLLRKVALRVADQAPPMADYEALAAKATNAERTKFVDEYLDKLLTSPAFYKAMLGFSHDVLAVGEAQAGFYGENYLGNLAAHLSACPAGTTHAGVLYGTDPVTYGKWDDGFCKDPAEQVTNAEPWWAPGTQVRIFQRFAPGPTKSSDKGDDCSIAQGSLYQTSFQTGCGCGPNLRYCIPYETYYDWSANWLEESARRMVWDEPARLMAHVIWNDRPLSDIVLSNYSVAPVALKHAYIRGAQGMAAGTAVDAVPFFRASDYESTPSDPEHAPSSPLAWHEFVVERMHPFYLSLAGTTPNGGMERKYAFDPRKELGTPKGLPYAGVLTTPGFLSTFPRERVRGARAMEIFACRDFTPPPATQKFNAYKRDPAVEGTCQHCHAALDPASIFFKRPSNPAYGTDRMWAGFPPSGVQVNDYAEPFIRFNRVFVANTHLTPVTDAQVTANPQSRFIDFLPPDQSLLNIKGDGTIGPLGFGKIVVESGEFDKCMVRKVHKRLVGRDLSAGEQTTIDELAKGFRDEGRNVRKLIKKLVARDEFRRGL
jgi:Protein of unknown function (DUF1585)